MDLKEYLDFAEFDKFIEARENLLLEQLERVWH